MATFAITATIVRPPFGLLVDRFGRKRFLVLGLVLFCLATLGYAWAPTIALILLFRVLHGVGWSGATTAITTLAADIAPEQRRGELIGYAGMASNLGAALGPILGFAVAGRFGYGRAFLSSFGIVSLSLVMSTAMHEPKRPPQSTKKRRHWIETVVVRESFLAATTAAFLSFSYGGVTAFLPLFALQRGLTNPGLYFALYATCLLLSRLVAGRLSDRTGRRAVILPAYSLYLAGMLVLSLTTSPVMLLAAAALNGFGFGAAHPALMTLAVDQVSPDRRGLSVAQFQLFYDLGIGLGSLVLGGLLDLLDQNYSTMYLIATAIGLAGVVLYWTAGSKG